MANIKGDNKNKFLSHNCQVLLFDSKGTLGTESILAAEEKARKDLKHSISTYVV